MKTPIETPLPSPQPTAPPTGRRGVKLLLIAGCLLMAAMWGYVVVRSVDPPLGVYQLQDTTWRVEAEKVCLAARADLEALASTDGGFIEEPTVEQMQARAVLIDQATDILDTMVDDLMAIEVDNDRDREILAVFETHYRMVLSDRRRYAASLAGGENVRYTETVVQEAGGPVSNVVTDFTAGVKSNDIPPCSPPNDVVNTKAP